jgi:hypothetical protein
MRNRIYIALQRFFEGFLFQILSWAHHEKPHKKVDTTDYSTWKSPVVGLPSRLLTTQPGSAPFREWV